MMASSKTGSRLIAHAQGTETGVCGSCIGSVRSPRINSARGSVETAWLPRKYGAASLASARMTPIATGPIWCKPICGRTWPWHRNVPSKMWSLEGSREISSDWAGRFGLGFWVFLGPTARPLLASIMDCSSDGRTNWNLTLLPNCFSCFQGTLCCRAVDTSFSPKTLIADCARERAWSFGTPCSFSSSANRVARASVPSPQIQGLHARCWVSKCCSKLARRCWWYWITWVLSCATSVRSSTYWM